jgi:hypothetical protein
LVSGIERSKAHFDFVCGARKNGRAAAGTEKPPGVVACLTVDRHRILREYRRGVKKRPMMLAAVETVTKADPVWSSRRHDSNVAAQATARESVHGESPPESSGHSAIGPSIASENLAGRRKFPIRVRRYKKHRRNWSRVPETSAEMYIAGICF